MGSSRKGGGGPQDAKEAVVGMPIFVSSLTVAHPATTEGNILHTSQGSNVGTLEQSNVFQIKEAMDLSTNPLSNKKPGSLNLKTSGLSVASDPLQFGVYDSLVASTGMTLLAARAGALAVTIQKAQQHTLLSSSSAHIENWGESTMADTSPWTDTSTDVDTDEKNQRFEERQVADVAASDSSDKSKDKSDMKTLRRLAQNREAARKSRLKKKAYIQQLESSNLMLNQLEQDLQRARQQGIFISSSGDQSHSMGGNVQLIWASVESSITRVGLMIHLYQPGALAFGMEYARWLEEHNRQAKELRAAANSHASDDDLQVIVDDVMKHYDELFCIKSVAAKADVFHILSGMWMTPAERCFLWLGGFRSSELLKLLASHLEPLAEQQLVGICNLQQSSQQAEDALSQGMEALQQSLSETLVSGSLGSAGSSGIIVNYMGQMAMAMGKLGTLENFLCQADNLRQQTLQQLQCILTTRQSARALLAIHDYFSRLRALSSLWLARPQE
ncbi:hypothetical protein MUK42_26484 [Musa troglodytarum]|uniref:Uncharacterized protein n=1 Tax=Musa troglodytarum TaxID=320322 RepID=A0A9E7F6C4_9LILI|nr:hypothetical protein MUK42_26484 [Musa troglodytarum]